MYRHVLQALRKSGLVSGLDYTLEVGSFSAVSGAVHRSESRNGSASFATVKGFDVSLVPKSRPVKLARYFDAAIKSSSRGGVFFTVPNASN